MSEDCGETSLRLGWNARRELLRQRLMGELRLARRVIHRRHRALKFLGALDFDGTVEEWSAWVMQVRAKRAEERVLRRLDFVEGLANPWARGEEE